ncbi:MAG: hypothetical protein V2J89_16955 [Halieaceae bacterium]|jgi:hypothetical protein|nr:hypothetical protein [Halieaceae bacterium]
MTRKLAGLVCWLANLWIVMLPVAVLYTAVDFNLFQGLAREKLTLAIQWSTVAHWQWLALWLLTVAYLGIGYLGVINLRCAFVSFARGQWFNADNSRYLRAFSLLLIAQACAKPVHHALASVLLSWQHAPGTRILSIAFDSDTLVLLASGLVMWVMSDLLVVGMRADAENKQFV